LKKFLLLLVVVGVAAYLYFFGLPTRQQLTAIKNKVVSVAPSALDKSEQGGDNSGADGEKKGSGEKSDKEETDPTVYTAKPCKIKILGYRWVDRLTWKMRGKTFSSGVRKGMRMIAIRARFSPRMGYGKIEAPHQLITLNYKDVIRRSRGVFAGERGRLKVLTAVDCLALDPEIVFNVPEDVEPEAMKLQGGDWTLSLARVPFFEKETSGPAKPE